MHSSQVEVRCMGFTGKGGGGQVRSFEIIHKHTSILVHTPFILSQKYKQHRAENYQKAIFKYYLHIACTVHSLEINPTCTEIYTQELHKYPSICFGTLWLPSLRSLHCIKVVSSIFSDVCSTVLHTSENIESITLLQFMPLMMAPKECRNMQEEICASVVYTFQCM